MNFLLEDEEVNVAAKCIDNDKAVLTAQLIMEVFNWKNTGLRVHASSQRLSELNREMNKLYSALDELEKDNNSRFVLKTLKALLGRESQFAAFKRDYIRKRLDRYPQLEQYI